MDWNDYFYYRNKRQAQHRAKMDAMRPTGCGRPEVLDEKGKHIAGAIFWVAFFALLAYLAHLG